jgi:hypothetical protein
MKIVGMLVTGVALAAVTLSADAAIKLFATRIGSFVKNGASEALPLNDAGAITLTFNLPANKKMLLTYSAVCSVGATSGYVEIGILVNGVSIAPLAGTSDPFCSANHTTTYQDGYVRSSITTQIQGLAGANTVLILASRPGPGDTVMRISNSALLVYD